MAPFSCSEINKVKQSISWFYIYLLGKSDIFNHFTCVGPFPCGTLYQIVWTWYCKYIYKLSKIYTCLGLWVTTNGLVGHPFRCFWEIYEQQICLTMAYLIWLCGQIVNDFFFSVVLVAYIMHSEMGNMDSDSYFCSLWLYMQLFCDVY